MIESNSNSEGIDLAAEILDGLDELEAGEIRYRLHHATTTALEQLTERIGGAENLTRDHLPEWKRAAQEILWNTTLQYPKEDDFLEFAYGD